MRELGMKEGRKIGLEEGERRKPPQIAEKLLAKGMQEEEVAAITELPLEEVQSLRKP